MVNFNPYPIIDIFKTDSEGLQRYMIRIFESNTILISNSILDTLSSADSIRAQFEKDNFQSLYTVMKKNYERNGNITLKILASIESKEIKNLVKAEKLPPFYKQFLQMFKYEVREPKNMLTSFIIGDDKILFPIGIGGENPKTFFIIEVRDSNMIKKANSIFSKAWNIANPVLQRCLA